MFTRQTFETTMRDTLVDWITEIDWMYFFTGTFRNRMVTAKIGYEIARKFWEEETDLAYHHENGQEISWVMFGEGFDQLPNDHCFSVAAAKEFNAYNVGPTRQHVHGLLHIKPDPIIKKNSLDPNHLWKRWYAQYGRCLIEKIDTQRDCVSYCTKYAGKAAHGDRWGFHFFPGAANGSAKILVASGNPPSQAKGNGTLYK